MWNKNLPLGGATPRVNPGTPSRKNGGGAIMSEPRRRMIARGISDAKDECKSILFADSDDVKMYVSSMHASTYRKYGPMHILTGLIIGGFVFVGSYYATGLNSITEEVQRLHDQMEPMSELLSDTRLTLSVLEAKNRKLDGIRSDLSSQLDNLSNGYHTQHTFGAIVSANGNAAVYDDPVVSTSSTKFYIDPVTLPKIERDRRESIQLRRIEVLKKNIQDISKRELLDRFGPGPHRVEFHIAFSHDSEEEPSDIGPKKFVVETAPANLMPHSVLLFLEMVQHSLWDQTAIVHNKDHVLTASPTNFFTGKSKIEEFSKAGFSRVSFQEYSEHYPHEKYTLGFAGRPGGPDFYISIDDNMKRHGPGGFTDADIVEEADPCFAKVVEGFDAVDRIYKEGVNSDLGMNIVGIHSAKILPPKMKMNNKIDSSDTQPIMDL